MPPPPQKGTGKKNRDVRQSRSRNTTPSLGGAPDDAKSTAYLELPLRHFQTGQDLIQDYGSAIPSSKELNILLDRLATFVARVDARTQVCDKGMRLIAAIKKDRLEELDSERRAEENTERLRRDAADEEERGRNKTSKTKKRKEISSTREERPLTHGAHGLAPQDGSMLGKLYFF